MHIRNRTRLQYSIFTSFHNFQRCFSIFDGLGQQGRQGSSTLGRYGQCRNTWLCRSCWAGGGTPHGHKEGGKLTNYMCVFGQKTSKSTGFFWIFNRMFYFCQLWRYFPIYKCWGHLEKQERFGQQGPALHSSGHYATGYGTEHNTYNLYKIIHTWSIRLSGVAI